MRKFAVLLASAALAFSAFGCQAWGTGSSNNCCAKCNKCNKKNNCSKCRRGNCRCNNR